GGGPGGGVYRTRIVRLRARRVVPHVPRWPRRERRLFGRLRVLDRGTARLVRGDVRPALAALGGAVAAHDGRVVRGRGTRRVFQLALRRRGDRVAPEGRLRRRRAVAQLGGRGEPVATGCAVS